MVGLGGLEPPTSPLSGLTPIHLGARSYKFGERYIKWLYFL